MVDIPLESLNLGQWLERIQSLHPLEIDMGLQRVSEVAARLQLGSGAPPAPLVITVAGTNGKGSCVAMLDAILRAAGYRCGCYTSPHLLDYNERVTINGQAASDALFCEAFLQISRARQDISLSYFEYSTLAGLWILRQAQLQVAILEVGLGGRLDAVNIIDADLAVISSIDLDHQDYLGDTRELIGFEKAGIMRSGRPAVCGDTELPQSVRAHAAGLQVPLYQQGVDYGFTALSGGWSWTGRSGSGDPLQLDELPYPPLDLLNAATVLQALHLLPGMQVNTEAIHQGLTAVRLPGRFQQLDDGSHPFPVIVDVAHNPQAARLLAAKLAQLQAERGGRSRCRIHLLLAMMRDKDHAGFFKALENTVDFWYIAHFAQPRCMEAGKLSGDLRVLACTGSTGDGRTAAENRITGPCEALAAAYQLALQQCRDNDLIVASGSFYTVAEVMQIVDASNSQQSRR